MKDNLKEERIMILEMVRENKITADEATKLLNSLSESVASTSTAIISGFDSEELEEKFDKFYGSVQTFANDLKGRLGDAYKKAEPHVKSTTKKVMEKTATVMEDLSKTIHDGAKKVQDLSDVELEDVLDEMDDEQE